MREVRHRAWHPCHLVRWLGAAFTILYGPGAAAAQTSTVVAVADTSKVASGTNAEAEEQDNAIPLCKTDLRLSGAVYNATRPERSFALFHVSSGHAGELYRVGMWVGTFEVLAVEPNGVLLRDRAGECRLPILADAGARHARAAPAHAARAPAKHGKPPKSQVFVVGKR